MQRFIVIPQAYRTYKIVDNDGSIANNNDRRSNFVQPSIFARDDEQETNNKQVGNLKISAYGFNLSDHSEVWHINTNNNHFYTGKFERSETPNGTTDENFMFYTSNGNRITRGDGDTIDLAIGSKKTTEMIKLELSGYESKDLDLNLNTGNRSAIRAAFFSAAFLLQRNLADKLDVDPNEIEISEKIIADRPFPIIYLNDALANGAGLVSYLYQDDNLEKLIQDIVSFNTPFMKSLVDDHHRKECLTTCQKCLLTYYNRGYHHILDWRLGVGILRLFLDKEYDFGFDSTKRNTYEELKDYDEILNACKKKRNWEEEEGGKLLHYRNSSQRDELEDSEFLEIIYHPLWNKKSVIDSIPPNNLREKVKLYNTFNVLRSDLSEDSHNIETHRNRDPETGIEKDREL